ncbi:hypothetical protein AYO44_00775 [Planctomycetaceae bacterium SCGC AG-212-F19]|nr:hypothetical protein AYO44_00775 [Planctomycetaceae bacterium SCGC AG-212-F19]
MAPDPLHHYVTTRLGEVIHAIEFAEHQKYLRNPDHSKKLHPRFAVEGELGRISDLLRDVFGNPFNHVTVDPAWRTANVTGLAEAIYTERAFDRMPILADALEDAGCTTPDVLNHCRQPGEHVRGCWVVDLVLGKE